MTNGHTCLYPWHVGNDAKIVDFAGWDMPLNYASGAKSEHLMVRRSCGLFDVSHMGRFLVTAHDSSQLEEYERLISSAVASLAPGTGSYGLLCRPDGTVIDDIFNFRLDETRYLLVVNAANRDKDMDWIRSNSNTLEVRDVSEEIAMIAVQGPRALEVLRLAGFADQVDQVPARNAVSGGDLFVDGILTRTGYTGEDGAEIYAPAEKMTDIWTGILDAAEKAGIECGAVGLAARDSLRFEPGFALYGHELTDELTPREAVLKWACKLGDDDADFIGKDAIRAKYAEGGNHPVLRTVRMVDAGMPRQDMRIFDDAGNDIGWVASGMASPSLGGFYANVFILKDHGKANMTVNIEIRGKLKSAVVVKRPIYRIL